MAVLETDKVNVHAKDHDGTEIRFIVSEKSDIGGNKGVNMAADSLKFYEKHLGAYPHDQLDVIVTASDEGGMEYPGVVTINDNPAQMKQAIAHEIGHQWFYGMVSNDAFHDPWIDEGITQFLTTLYLINSSSYLKTEDVKTVLEDSIGYATERTDMLPANLSLDAYDDEEQERMSYSLSVYTQTSYELLSLFEEHGGTDEALSFLHDYFETYQYKQVDSEELIHYLTSYLDLENGDNLSDWLEISHSK